MKPRKEYGPMQQHKALQTWDGEPIYIQQIRWVNERGEVIRTGERQVLASGEPVPRQHFIPDNRGLV